MFCVFLCDIIVIVCSIISIVCSFLTVLQLRSNRLERINEKRNMLPTDFRS